MHARGDGLISDIGSGRILVQLSMSVYSYERYFRETTRPEAMLRGVRNPRRARRSLAGRSRDFEREG
jgi:hypothetical protein